MFSGKKTYAVAGAGLLFAGLGFLLGFTTPEQSAQVAFEMLGLAGIRHGIARK